MAKFILTKTQKGAKYQYQVIDTTTNEAISTRVSTRDYVACTINGDFYFGRLDLIGKGDHGSKIKRAAAVMNDPKADKDHKDYCRDLYADLNNIAYLTK